jgi:hypothetical protein
MSSGVTILTAVGQQDKWIHSEGAEGVSFFNQVWRKHSNFSQSIEKNYIQGAIRNGGLSKIQIEKSGDLLGYTYFSIDNGTQALDSSDWTTLIEYVELRIGGEVIDRQYSEWSETVAVDMLAGNSSRSALGPHPGASSSSYFFPLRFFFCETPSLALPLAGIQLQDVEIYIKWGADAEGKQFECYSQFYYVDADERAALTNTRHMLIYQVQKSIPSRELIHDLTFNHPIKFIASSNTAATSPLKRINNRIKIQINGNDVTPFRWGKPHFCDVSHYFHTSFVTSPDIFMYPFCVTTNLFQPTGSLNASRVSSLRIVSESLPLTDTIWALNLNVLTIDKGCCGLRFAN